VEKIGSGTLLFLGFISNDTDSGQVIFAEKILNLRIFDDEQGKLNRSLLEYGGGVLGVSQFTLLAD
jgi:D-tyrosyl-tRNA(Tyr) deacylase